MERRPDPEPLEVDDVRLIGALTLLWVAALAVLAALDLAGTSIHGWWLVMCLAGSALGAYGTHVCARRKSRLTT